MDQFAHVRIHLRIRKHAYGCTLAHVYAFTHVSKLYSIYKCFSFAHGGDQVQISVACMQNVHISVHSVKLLTNNKIRSIFRFCVTQKLI